MSIWDVHSALVTSLTDLAVVTEDRIAFEMRPFTPPTDDGYWLELFNLPAEQVPVTLGDEGQDRYSGVFQIDVMGPAGKGVRGLIETAGSITAYYTAGKRFNKGTQSVYIHRSQVSKVQKDGAKAKISVSIFWSSLITRNP